MIVSTTFPALLALQFGLGSGGGATMVPFLIQLVAIFAIFYFLLIRPQQTQKRKQEAALRGIKRGDQVITAGGLVGDVIHVKESTDVAARTMEDHVTIRSGESRLVVERGRIARVITGGGTAKE